MEGGHGRVPATSRERSGLSVIRYILDTDHLTLLQEAHPSVVQRVAACAPDELAVSVISVEEQLSGWYTVLRRTKKPEQLARVYERLTIRVSSLSRRPIGAF